MSNNFNNALKQALNKEFCWLDSFENPYDDYVFSDSFENNMKGICQQPEYTYMNIGSHKIRKRVILILVAMMALVISGCAIAHYYIHCNEAQNDNYGTLDVEFEIKGNLPEIQVELIFPEVPPNYKIYDETIYSDCMAIEYRNTAGEIIIYSQQIGLDEMGSVSINNETDVFEEVTINGYKGYHSELYAYNNNHYTWTDGYCLYSLQGTCSNDTLLEIIKSIKLPE